MKNKKVIKTFLFNKKVTMKFLKKTKKGEYAPIEEYSLSIPRVNDLREEIYLENSYYHYSIR